MLKFFTRLERTRNWVIIFFAALLVIGMVVAGVYNRAGVATANPFRSREVLARVRGDDVTVADYSLYKKMQEDQYSRFGGQITLAQLGLTPERLLDQTVNNRIAVQEAERRGLLPSEQEVRETITRLFSDAANKFDLKRYKDFVVRNYGGVSLYEQSVRESLAADRLRAFVTAGVQVSEEDVKRDYVRENTSFDLVYVPVTPADVAKKITPSDEELRQFFEEHKTDYRFLEPQRKVRYLFISQEKVGEKLQIPDEDLRREYEQLKPENKMSGVRVQQIVMKVARPELDQEVLGKASALVARIRKDDLTAEEEAFAEAARGNSEDPATAHKGGWLPNPVRRNPNRKPGAPGDAQALVQNVFDWQEGQIGDPLKTGNAYYIFRRGPSIPKTFEEAKNELLVSARNRRSYAAAQQIARRAAERLKATKDFEAVAREFAAEANMSPAEMIKVTPFVKPDDVVPDIGNNQQFHDAIKALEEPGQMGDQLAIPNGFAVPSLVEKREPRIPELDEVKDRVAEAFKNERAKQQLEQAARELASAAGSADALKAAAERLGLTAETEEGYRLGRPLGKAGADPALDAAVFALKAGETTKTPVKVGDNWVVVGATKREDADLAKFGEQRTSLIESALNTRRSQVFDEFITSVRRRLEQEGEVELKSEALAKLEETEAPSAVPRMPPINVPAPAGE